MRLEHSLQFSINCYAAIADSILHGLETTTWLQEPVAELGVGLAGLSVKEEPEFLKQWKVEQEVRLKTKDAEEEVEKEKLKEKAKEELVEW